ncbi:FmdB family zinc ribbon protein [Microbacterium sp.]|uniref:FmdB family zinc ribbon protein n=1 Tax=Microbacterium sp. TaxID=51671 RepID=UPI003A8476F7
MPTYAYSCTECAHAFDAVQSFSDPSLTECPTCRGRLRKQYGSIGVTFSGSGFYRTDSRGAAPGSGTSAGDSASSPASSKTEVPTSPAPTGS